MKTISVVGLLALLGGLGCSGRYEVGDEGEGGAAGAGGTGSGVAGSGAFGSIAGTAPGTGGFAGSGTSGGGGGAPPGGSSCDPPFLPTPILGDLAEPAVVWERVTRLVEGEGAPPPSTLPAATTYAWASDLVTQAFGRARQEGSAPGAATFVEAWLFRDSSPPLLTVDWATVLVEAEPVLERLMLEPVGQHGYGAFSEPGWLLRFPTISHRGAGIVARVFGSDPPLPPIGTPSAEPSAVLTRRQELSQVLEPSVACQVCHRLFDSLGYAYGHFNELGAYEAMEDGLPIDTSGSYGPDPVLFSFANIQELGVQVAASCEAKKGLVVAFARTALALEGASLAIQYELVGPHEERLQQAFLASAARSYQDLVRAYALSPLVLQR